MRRLAALILLILIAFLPAITAGKGGHSVASHSKPTDVARPPKPPKPRAVSSVKRTSRGKIARSSSAKHQFQASSPCPATGKTTGSCKGYVIDHKTPLACGGADAPENMQWQTSTAARLKDKTERASCGT